MTPRSSKYADAALIQVRNGHLRQVVEGLRINPLKETRNPVAGEAAGGGVLRDSGADGDHTVVDAGGDWPAPKFVGRFGLGQAGASHTLLVVAGPSQTYTNSGLRKSTSSGDVFSRIQSPPHRSATVDSTPIAAACDGRFRGRRAARANCVAPPFPREAPGMSETEDCVSGTRARAERPRIRNGAVYHGVGRLPVGGRVPGRPGGWLGTASPGSGSPPVCAAMFFRSSWVVTCRRLLL